jgi:hypothetical protein
MLLPILMKVSVVTLFVSGYGYLLTENWSLQIPAKKVERAQIMAVCTCQDFSPQVMVRSEFMPNLNSLGRKGRLVFFVYME